MMELESAALVMKPLSVAEYAQGLARSGRKNLRGAPGTFWVKYDSVAMMRTPQFCLDVPSPGEVRRVLWQGPAALASYQIHPDDFHPVNAWLYVCTDRTYGLDKLSPTMRRNVRRGLLELRIEPVPADRLMAHGAQTFLDTRRRNGLTDSTPEEFRRQIALRAKCPGHAFLGAWKRDQLAAYLSIVEVDDWVEITTGFSADALLHLRPNDALLFSALSYYLLERQCRIVTFGTSSIQSESNKAGLHAFKIKVGFEAQPIRRVFVLHPLLRLFINRITLWGVNTALHFVPGNLRFRRADGVLACILAQHAVPKLR
jgi:hypothetical protein